MNTRAELPGRKQHSFRAAMALGRAWLKQGRAGPAAAQFEIARSLQPDHPEAHRWSSYLHVHQGDTRAAAERMRQAVAKSPADETLQQELALLGRLAGEVQQNAALPDHPGGRLRFAGRYERTHHRSGWRYAVRALEGLHNRNGVLFEGFLEDPFAWQHPRAGIRSGPDLLRALRNPAAEPRLTSEELRIVPYREPWVGFLHNPPAMPDWFHYPESPQTIFAKTIWRESLPHCVGLFTLSEYAADWLRKETGKPVSAVLHPTATPAILFDFERFAANPRKRIIQVGWWLRRLGAIDRLPIAADNPLHYSKLWLMPHFFDGARDYLSALLAKDFERFGRPLPEHASNTSQRQHVPDEEYDRLLGENICFVDLIDASANNTVIECLVRGTPILVNALPAVVEYLGAEYPLYYENPGDAAARALDLGRLRAAHQYLVECSVRSYLDADSFRRSVEASEVYRLL